MPIGNPSIDNYKPLGMSVVVQVFNITKSAGNIALGAAKNDKWFRIIKVSEGMENAFKPGDYVIGNPQQGIALEFDGDKNTYIQFASHVLIGHISKDDAEEVEERKLHVVSKSKIIT